MLADILPVQYPPDSVMDTKDRRLNFEDRRRSIEEEIPPCHEEQGEIICEERRQSPDRRINNIHVEWSDETEVG